MQAVWQTAKYATIIHGHGIYYQPYDLAVWSSIARRLPLVLSPYFYQRARLPWGAYLGIHKILTFIKADIVTVSEHEKSLLVANSLVGDRNVHVIYPRVIIPDFRRPPQGKVRTSRARACFIGRISYAKGAPDLPEIVKRCRTSGLRIELTVAGPDDGALAAMQRNIYKHDVESAVKYVGIITEDEKQMLLRSCDILLLPSTYEAFGIVLAEAMANGCIPIAYNVGAIPEVLNGDAYGVPVTPYTATAMANAIVALYDSWRKADTIRAAGWQSCKERFSVERWDQQWATLYRSVAG